MPNLSDTRSLTLSRAAQREDGNLLPLPNSLRGGAAHKVVGALMRRGLVTEIVTENHVIADVALNTFWRNEPDGRLPRWWIPRGPPRPHSHPMHDRHKPLVTRGGFHHGPSLWLPGGLPGGIHSR